MKKLLSIASLFLLVTFNACNDEETNSLSVNPAVLNFLPAGNSINVNIQTDASNWILENTASDWVTASANSGNGPTSSLKLTVNSRTLEARTATLVIRAGTAKPVELKLTQPSSQYLYVTTADMSALTFEQNGGAKELKIVTDAPQWSISSNAEWLQFDKTSGSAGPAVINVTSLFNPGDERTAIITITSQGAATLTIPVTQKGSLYPNYNTSPLPPDATGMSSSAMEIASKIHLGWNLGNSLEAIGGETAWGNPMTTKPLIDMVKANGFNAIRIPCSWNQNMVSASTAQIKTAWLNRVKEVVQYCIDNDLHVILNIHWDGGWLENNCTPAKQTENNAKQKAFWQQIATHLRDFDERLLFASANEPNVSDATQMAVLNSYHQTFIDAVRSTGGKNSHRVLIVQGPSTDIEKTNTLMTTLPVDQIEHKMMVEVHYYTPWNFCGLEADADWGKMFYYWGNGYHSDTDPTRNATWGEESTVDGNFQLMKTQFIDKGIPVVLGEYSVIRRALTGENLTKHLASRAYYLKYVTKQAKAYGLLPFYWDSGFTGANAGGIFNRNTRTVFDQQALDALIEGANQ